MKGPLRNRLHRLGRDRRGTTAIEFALIAPVLGIGLMGVIYVAMG